MNRFSYQYNFSYSGSKSEFTSTSRTIFILTLLAVLVISIYSIYIGLKIRRIKKRALSENLNPLKRKLTLSIIVYIALIYAWIVYSAL